ncbi:MAG: D-glycerate dehydrogenase [Planctomycetes bacterium]|nr:D-glycerate dehydrogenase [Planctomycetota bacterium]
MGLDVFVTRRIPQPGLDRVRAGVARMEVNPHDRVLTRPELLAGVRGRDGVLSLLTDRIDAEVMDAAGPRCRVFANYAVGFNNVDVAEATRRGVLVTHTPGVLTETTADMAWALLFAAARRIAEGDRYTRAGRFEGWGPMLLLGQDVSGKTLAIVGAGRIGAAVAQRSRGFSMRVLYVDVRANEALERDLGARRVALDEALREADLVSLHVSLEDSTRHLIGARELALMKSTAVLVNTSRGPVVDEAALVEALRSGRIAGAGLDVYEDEPRLAPGLAALENVVLCPHTASATTETRTLMAIMAADNLLSALRGGRPPNLVNPEAVPPRPHA